MELASRRRRLLGRTFFARDAAGFVYDLLPLSFELADE